jgi:hypothetical protein
MNLFKTSSNMSLVHLSVRGCVVNLGFTDETRYLDIDLKYYDLVRTQLGFPLQPLILSGTRIPRSD